MKKFFLILVIFFSTLGFALAENEAKILPSQTGIIQK